MDIFHDVERMMHSIGMTTTGDSEKEVYWYTEQIRMSAEQLEESLTSDSPCEVIDSVLEVVHANIGFLLSLWISPEGCKKMFDAKMDYTHRERRFRGEHCSPLPELPPKNAGSERSCRHPFLKKHHSVISVVS
ncbi:MAG: hypothetical protein NZ744_17575 [Pirellulaceae bacterium]|nr:hypothetical protein [Pirellulaceae bacterium]